MITASVMFTYLLLQGAFLLVLGWAYRLLLAMSNHCPLQASKLKNIKYELFDQIVLAFALGMTYGIRLQRNSVT